MLCTHCKKTNHTVENCYFKYGSPSEYRTKDQASTMHVSNESTGLVQKPTQSQTGSCADQSMQISTEDYNQLMTLLHSSKKDIPSSSQTTTANHIIDSSHHIISSLSQVGNPENFMSLWILDSGASDHVCPHIK